MTDETKKDYEIAFIALNEAGPKAVLEALKGLNADILFEGPVSHVTLSYKIKKQSQADFGYVQFSLEPGAVGTLDTQLKNEASLLRFLLITPPFMKAKTRAQGFSKGKPLTKSAPEVKLYEPLSNEALEKKIEEILK